MLTLIRHGEQACAGMLMDEVFVFKEFPVDGLPACAVIVCDIPSLNHKPWYDPVEFRPCIPQLLPTPSYSLLTSAQLLEVLDSLRTAI